MARHSSASASRAASSQRFSRIERESSTHSSTWYFRLLGLVRRIQILSLRKPEAM